MAARLLPAFARAAQHRGGSVPFLEAAIRSSQHACRGIPARAGKGVSAAVAAGNRHFQACIKGAGGGMLPQLSTAVMGHHMSMTRQSFATPHLPTVASSCSITTSSSSSSSSSCADSSGAGEGSEGLEAQEAGPDGVHRGQRKRQETLDPWTLGDDPPSHPPYHTNLVSRVSSLLGGLLQSSSALPLVRSISCTAALSHAAPVVKTRSDRSQGPQQQVQLTDTWHAQSHKGAAAAAEREGAPGEAELSGSSEVVGPQEFRAQHDIRVHASRDGTAVPEPVQRLQDAPFPPQLRKLLLAQQFQVPTPVQAQAWPVAVSGADLVAIASTGSGKTVGYLLPAMARILTGQIQEQGGQEEHQHERRHYPHHAQHRVAKGPLVLVLAPTRELAVQINSQVELYGQRAGLNSACVYGGAYKGQQVQRITGLGRSPLHVLVATPGRLLDLMRDGVLHLRQVQYFVLDEADRMLDMGFESQVLDIVDNLAPQHQSLFFSATWPREVRQLASRISPDPVSVFVGKVSQQHVAARTITQEVKIVDDVESKLAALHAYLHQLGLAPASSPHPLGRRTRAPMAVGPQAGAHAAADPAKRVMVFVATKRGADWLQYWLGSKGDLPPAESIHGGRTQRERDVALHNFRTGHAPILVATDVAARGLDIPHVTAVVNFDAPIASRHADYVHRIGRTGRAGASGKSLALLDRHNAEDKGFAAQLIHILREAGQPVSQELQAFAPRPGAGHGASWGAYPGRGGGGGGGSGSRGRYASPRGSYGYQGRGRSNDYAGSQFRHDVGCDRDGAGRGQRW